MGQQSFSNGHPACLSDVFNGRTMAKVGQCGTILRKGRLRLITETHKRFLASLSLTTKKHISDFRWGHRPGIGISRIFSEGAVAATVPAKVRNWQEDFARIRYGSALVPVT